MNEILLTIVRGAFAYLVLLTVSRIIGRKAIGQMTFFDYTVTITFGSLTAHFGIGSNKTPLNSLTVLLVFGALYLLTSAIVAKNIRIRKLVDSEPVVVIAKGEFVKANMKRTHMTVGLLNKLLREKNVFNIIDVEYAIFESNGQLSVLPKANRQPLTPADMNIPAAYRGLTTELIIDGLVLYENMAQIGKDENWLRTELASKGIPRPEDVFFAALDTAGNFYVTLGNNGPEEQGKYRIE